jgi:anti-anti-sigma regulatory factor
LLNRNRLILKFVNMSKSNEYYITAKSILGNTINTREAAQILLHNLKNDNNAKITLDFSDVDFISRSFADSLIKKRNELMHSGSFEFKIQNASDSVMSMLESVEKTQHYKHRSQSSFRIIKYSEAELVANYFLSL